MITHLPPKQAGAPVAEASTAGDWIFTSQVADLPDGSTIQGGIEAQTRQVLSNVKESLRKCGADLRNLVHVTVYLTDMFDRGAMNKVWNDVFQGSPPARATLEVAALASPEHLIELTAIAFAGRQKDGTSKSPNDGVTREASGGRN